MEVFGGVDLVAGEHMTNLLLQHGIPSYYEGSVIYGLSVPKSLARRAREVLRSKDERRTFDWDRPEAWREVAFHTPHRAAVERTRASTPVGAALRELRTDDVRRFPDVAVVRLAERSYLGKRGAWKTAYEIEVVLHAGPKGRDGEMHLMFQWWEESIVFQGGHGSGGL